MAGHDLQSDDGLRKACREILEVRGDPEWIRELTRFLQRVADAGEDERASLPFQRELWDQNPISAVGQGNISVDRATEDSDFRRWLAKASMQPLPEAREGRLAMLGALYNELVERLKPLCERTPHLKIFRVLAALFPGALTTVAHARKLQRLHVAMFGPSSADRVERHLNVLNRLAELLGPPAASPEATAERITLPWWLYARYVELRGEEPTEVPADKPGEERLVPLPAARRRKGLTAFRGYLSTVLSALEFARDGVTREELLEHLRAESPDVKQSSLATQVYSLKGELGVIRLEGNRYLPTERGEALLESGDPDELADYLLTRVLGIDFAILEVQREGSLASRELSTRIQKINPGWKTSFAPDVIISWLRALGVLETPSEGRVRLTPMGTRWAARIHWTPEPLPGEPAPIFPAIPSVVEPQRAATAELPSLADIQKDIAQKAHFSHELIATLHAGLWAHPRRHFAILTGLSGSGKTLLALSYAKAIAAPSKDDEQRVQVVSVQPAWYDPGPLLGYVNPLRADSYIRTPFLEFLMRASQDPGHPYVAILDEMNLSHPEQYMAPLLSAMETGAPIDLHTEDDLFDGVPNAIAYPSNLVLIGTVNMDETTHGLSDKVLDRAFTLEFWEIDLDAYPRWASRPLSADAVELTKILLREMMDALAPARLHFGWRIVDNVLDFLARATETGSGLEFARALDAVIYAKVLPKLRGDDSTRFRAALESAAAALQKHGLVKSHEKVLELRRDVELTGSARFWR